MFLPRSTLLGHVLRVHFDEAFVVDALKRNFPRPRIVVYNPGGRSENAIYDIECGGDPCLLVAIRYRPWPIKNLIVSLYGVPEAQVQAMIRKGPVIWPTK